MKYLYQRCPESSHKEMEGPKLKHWPMSWRLKPQPAIHSSDIHPVEQRSVLECFSVSLMHELMRITAISSIRDRPVHLAEVEPCGWTFTNLHFPCVHRASPSLTHCLLCSIVEAKVQVNFRQTVSRPVCLSVRRPFGIRDQFFFLLEISFR
jgi:hypothetical protein